MFSQFYILSPRGDCLITKDYRGDAPRGSAEIFFRHATSLHLLSPAPPPSALSSSGSCLPTTAASAADGPVTTGGGTAGGRQISSSSRRRSSSSFLGGPTSSSSPTEHAGARAAGGGGGAAAAGRPGSGSAVAAAAGGGGAAAATLRGVSSSSGISSRRGISAAAAAKKEPAPVFCVNGLTFAFLRRSGLFFVLTTQQCPSATLLIELLHRLTKVIQDFCGVLNEEAIRKNFVLIYELLDEMADFGYPQLTSTENLKSSIYSEALLVDVPPPMKQPFGGGLSTLSTMTTPKTIPSNASHRPVGLCSSGSSGSSSRASRVRSGLAAAGRLALSGTHISSSSHSGGAAVGGGDGLVGSAAGGSLGGGITRRSEIFVDILERLSVVLSASGELLHASLDGSIQMKSFLDGPCRLRLALNDDLLFSGQAAEDVAAASGGSGESAGGGGVSRRVVAAAAAAAAAFGGGVCVVDACNFHECVDLSDFAPPHRVLTFLPPDGEFVLMNYRVAHCAAVPFRIYPSLDFKPGSTKGELVVRIKADAPEQTAAASVLVSVPLAKNVVTCSVDLAPLPLQTQEYIPAEKRISWSMRKFSSGGEMTMRARFTTSAPAPATPIIRKEFGPISMTFEIPTYNVSNLQVRYLRTAEKSGASSPFRWVRYVTQSSSYICRL